MKINTKTKIYTHEGATAKKINVKQQLRRTLMACMLWENNFYESGEDVAERIIRLADQCDLEFLKSLAIEARTEQKLRHAPLLILLSMIKRGGKVTSEAIEEVINRPDEITELVAMYWMNGRKMLTRSMRQGLGKAFLKFDEYQLAKWNRGGDVKLRDVLFMSHAKPPKDKEDLFKRIANDELKTPDTWESKMAAGGDKKEVFTDLLTREKLGYMALLRNLRGMVECGVDEDLIKRSIVNPTAAPLPFRFIAAAKHAPRFERQLDEAMAKVLESKEKIGGKTVLLVDVSGSMRCPLSQKSDLSRIDAACALAILLSGLCEDIRIFTFSSGLVEVAPRVGMSLKDTIVRSQPNGTTYLGRSVCRIDQKVNYDRLVVITDEQSHDAVPDPKGRGYMLNIASYKNGVGYGPWIHIDGFSESCVDYIQEYEREINTKT